MLFSLVVKSRCRSVFDDEYYSAMRAESNKSPSEDRILYLKFRESQQGLHKQKNSSMGWSFFVYTEVLMP
ncbi:MAG: hypothetical protein A2061_02885 [Gallionellales bacterium GWA2_59_43]|nr:MAG: hypothetical protein A2061_02885 [Gallionellales bacterium GWA2_59_43]